MMCQTHKSVFDMDLTFKGCFIGQEIGTPSIVPLVLRVYVVVVGWIDYFFLVVCPAYICGILKPIDLPGFLQYLQHPKLFLTCSF